MTGKNAPAYSVDGGGKGAPGIAGNNGSSNQGTSNEGFEDNENEKPDERNTYFMAEINVPDSNDVSDTHHTEHWLDVRLFLRTQQLLSACQLAPVGSWILVNVSS